MHDIMMEQRLHIERNTESWIIRDAEISKDLQETLIGAHLNIYDYFGIFPVLVFHIDERPAIGKVFNDVYLLKPEDVPDNTACFLANGTFLRNCLQKELMDDKDKIGVPIHTLDGIQLIFTADDSHQKLAEIQRSHYGLLIVGVYGEPTPIHYHRGFHADDLRDTTATAHENTEN